MSVNLDLAINVVDDSIVITDNTDYGVGNIPNRSAVHIEYKLFYLPYAAQEESSALPNYGNYTATGLIIPGRKDGHFRVEAYATHDEETTSVKKEVFVFDTYGECVDDAEAVFKQCTGQETEDIMKFLQLELIESGITDLINAQRYKDAQCLLQKGENLCKDEKCKEC